MLRIEDLSDAERYDIVRKIVTDNPKQNQTRSGFAVLPSLDPYDDNYDDRYELYRERVSIYVANYERRLERVFNQSRIKLRLSNTGRVQAENLLLNVTVSSGWLHDRYIWSSPVGPRAPKPHDGRSSYLQRVLNDMPALPPRIGRHEVSYKDEPKWRRWFSATCEDFRHGQEWTFEGIIGIDPCAPDTKIVATITASNLRGQVQEVRQILRKEETTQLSSLIDLDVLKFIAKTPVDNIIRGKDKKAIDLKAFLVDEGDEDDYEEDD